MQMLCNYCWLVPTVDSSAMALLVVFTNSQLFVHLWLIYVKAKIYFINTASASRNKHRMAILRRNGKGSWENMRLIFFIVNNVNLRYMKCESTHLWLLLLLLQVPTCHHAAVCKRWTGCGDKSAAEKQSISSDGWVHHICINWFMWVNESWVSSFRTDHTPIYRITIQAASIQMH